MYLVKQKNSIVRGVFVISSTISAMILLMATTSYIRYGMVLPPSFFLPILVPFTLLGLNNSKVQGENWLRFMSIRLFKLN